MKSFVRVALVFGFCLALISNVYAVTELAEPTIYLFGTNPGFSHCEDFDSSSPGLEVVDVDHYFSSGVVGGNGLVSYTARSRVRVRSNTGTVLFTSPWIVITTGPLYDPAYNELNCDKKPSSVPTAPCVEEGSGSSDGWYFGVGIADHSGNQYLVHSSGFRAFSDAPINGETDHNQFKVWVTDLDTENVVTKFSFRDDPDNDIYISELVGCEVKDYNQDGDDDLIITREKIYPGDMSRRQVRISVYDLMSKTRTEHIVYTVRKPLSSKEPD